MPRQKRDTAADQEETIVMIMQYCGIIATGRFQRIGDVEPAPNRESHTDAATTSDDAQLWH